MFFPDHFGVVLSAFQDLSLLERRFYTKLGLYMSKESFCVPYKMSICREDEGAGARLETVRIANLKRRLQGTCTFSAN